MVKVYYINTELYHHGILGQKWGVRRYQNPDGTLTAEGKKRERVGFKERAKKVVKSDNFRKYAKIGAIAIGSMAAMYGLSLTPVGAWISSQMSAINVGLNFKNNMSKEITNATPKITPPRTETILTENVLTEKVIKEKYG